MKLEKSFCVLSTINLSNIFCYLYRSYLTCLGLGNTGGRLMTYSVRRTSATPPCSSGIGCCWKCSSISVMVGNHKCWTRHWPKNENTKNVKSKSTSVRHDCSLCLIFFFDYEKASENNETNRKLENFTLSAYPNHWVSFSNAWHVLESWMSAQIRLFSSHSAARERCHDSVSLRVAPLRLPPILRGFHGTWK